MEHNKPFSHIKEKYGVAAELNREVMLDGRKGIIASDMGNYVGVIFYDQKRKFPMPCHPTWEMKYLDTFGKIPKPSKGQDRYRKYLHSESDLSFTEWLKVGAYKY